MTIDNGTGYGETPHLQSDGLRTALSDMAKAAVESGSHVSVEYNGQTYAGALLREETRVRLAYVASSNGDVFAARKGKEGGYTSREVIAPDSKFRQFLTIILNPAIPSAPARITGRRINHNQNTDCPTTL